jgi:hypothetical protein
MGSVCARQDRLSWTGHASPAQCPSPTGSACCVNSWGASSAQAQCVPNALMSGQASQKANASAPPLGKVSMLKVSVLDVWRRAVKCVKLRLTIHIVVMCVKIRTRDQLMGCANVVMDQIFLKEDVQFVTLKTV